MHQATDTYPLNMNENWNVCWFCRFYWRNWQGSQSIRRRHVLFVISRCMSKNGHRKDCCISINSAPCAMQQMSHSFVWKQPIHLISGIFRNIATLPSNKFIICSVEEVSSIWYNNVKILIRIKFNWIFYGELRKEIKSKKNIGNQLLRYVCYNDTSLNAYISSVIIIAQKGREEDRKFISYALLVM